MARETNIATLAGAYTAERAAALSGVPKSTIHYWARHRVLAPSVSPERTMLWSYPDLLALRVIYWLRRPKRSREELVIPSTTMRVVRHALHALRDLDLDLFEDGRPTINVTRTGEVVISPPGGPPHRLTGQFLAPDVIDLIAPFDTMEGARGPDLSAPRPRLRIVPGKLSGSPHVVDTRIETCVLAALSGRGFSAERIAQLYPSLDQASIDQAIELEADLQRNLGVQAAA
jgi:uncharacterized protein (DUF433 family)